MAKLTDATVIQMRIDRLSGMSSGMLAKKYKVDKSTILDICNGRQWVHVFALAGCPPLAALLAVERNRKPGAKITPEIARNIKERLAKGETGRAIALRYGIHYASISDIKRGLTWKEVTASTSAGTSQDRPL